MFFDFLMNNVHVNHDRVKTRREEVISRHMGPLLLLLLMLFHHHEGASEKAAASRFTILRLCLEVGDGSGKEEKIIG